MCRKFFWGLALGAGLAGTALPAAAIETQTLLSSDHTIAGEQVIYPSGPAKITGIIATFAPGEVDGLAYPRHSRVRLCARGRADRGLRGQGDTRLPDR